jgi:DNA-binding LacI/PurR family transcriptional regulator
MVLLRPNHRSIAARCGVSASTVSRVLANTPHVAQATRTKVWAAAKEVGYEPDPRLAFLSRLRWRGYDPNEKVAVAVLVDRFTVAFDAERKFRYLGEEAHRLGLGIERMVFKPAARKRRDFGAELYNRGIAGVLVALHDPTCLPAIDWRRFSVVVCGEESPELNFPRVTTDWRQVFDVAFAQARARRRRRIGIALAHLAGPGLYREMLAEALLHRREMQAAGLEKVEIWEFDGDGPRVASCFATWVTEHRLDCVLANEMSPCLWRIPVPRPEILLITRPYVAHAPAGVDVQLGERMASALRVLHGLIVTNQQGPVEFPTRILFPGIWRESEDSASNRG